jgi:hypothetical protein
MLFYAFACVAEAAGAVNAALPFLTFPATACLSWAISSSVMPGSTFLISVVM